MVIGTDGISLGTVAFRILSWVPSFGIAALRTGTMYINPADLITVAVDA